VIRRTASVLVAALSCAAPVVFTQTAAPGSTPSQAPAAAPAQGRGGRGASAPAFNSPEVATDRRMAFRIYAPNAQAIRLAAGDIPGVGQTTQLTKAENGVWEVTIGPIDPGSYRYNFNVDGVATIDPRNPLISESNNNVWSLVHVPGSDVFDTRDVPHGALAAGPTTRRPSACSVACTSTLRQDTRLEPRSIRCSICSTAPATATTPGARWGGRTSSSTDSRRSCSSGRELSAVSHQLSAPGSRLSAVT
jgi:Carbohydrate-binding module 48 (Isoamylase N-terminal domain)